MGLLFDKDDIAAHCFKSMSTGRTAIRYAVYALSADNLLLRSITQGVSGVVIACVKWLLVPPSSQFEGH